MSRAKRILIFPAGTGIALEIWEALKYSKFVELYGGTSADDHSAFIYDHLISGFPYVDEDPDGFLRFLNQAIRDNGIDCVYPAHDSVCLFCSENAARIDAQVIAAEPKTASICRSKRATYEYLSDCDFIPKVYSSEHDIERYPVFVKPAVGQGARGARRIDDEETLAKALCDDSTLVISEYLPGMEYTVDCITDGRGELMAVKQRDRQRIQTGISVRSQELETSKQVWGIARTLNERFCFRGAWFFQVKEDLHGICKLMEVSARVAGTMGLSRMCGINFPLLTLFIFWDYDVSVLDNGYSAAVDRSLCSAYRLECDYEHVYLDFDDTLVLKGRVNTELVRFLYQAVDRGKVLHLLSRHKGDLGTDLDKVKICPSLFDEIIEIPDGEEKSDYITQPSAIFIDDSFAERKKVRDTCGIAVFDVDMIEGLYDWRM